MTAAKGRVLVVDDHSDIANSLGALLGVLGHDARTVTDSRQAANTAKEFRPVLALVDLSMPHIDGCQVAKQFRADPELKHICLVALTAYDDAKHRALSREAGFDAHIQKPDDPDLLQAIIAQFASGLL